VFHFFLVIGLRACVRIPTDLQANWPFRLSQPSLADALNAAVLVMIVAAVLPVAAVTIAGTTPLWPLFDVLRAAGLQLLSGILLIEAVLLRWSKVPLACEHIPSTDGLKVWWLLYAIALYNYAFRLSDWQAAALHSTLAMAAYLAFCTIGIVVVRVMRRRHWRGQSLEFDAVHPHAVERLNLSGALN
jgi:hypothetical protein